MYDEGYEGVKWEMCIDKRRPRQCVLATSRTLDDNASDKSLKWDILEEQRSLKDITNRWCYNLHDSFNCRYLSYIASHHKQHGGQTACDGNLYIVWCT